MNLGDFDKKSKLIHKVLTMLKTVSFCQWTNCTKKEAVMCALHQNHFWSPRKTPKLLT